MHERQYLWTMPSGGCQSGFTSGFSRTCALRYFVPSQCAYPAPTSTGESHARESALSETEQPADLVDNPAEVWGYMDGDLFRPLPKRPMLLGGYGPPPFDITMWDESVRHIIVAPTGV